MILGLDISTSCTGWCVLDDDKFINMGYIDTSKIKCMIKKSKHVRDEFLKLILRYEIDKVCIEENLQAFRPGLSSAKTLLTLARFNGIVSYIANDIFDCMPSYVNVNTARKLNGIKIDRKIKANTKEQIQLWVANHLAANGFIYAWPKKTLKSGPRAGMTVLQPGCFDAADAYVIANAYYVEQLKNIV